MSDFESAMNKSSSPALEAKYTRKEYPEKPEGMTFSEFQDWYASEYPDE